jgi:lipopolysaccharide transport system permease protein
MNDTTDTENWTTIIRPQGRWFDLKLGELWQYRDLVVLFVRRDFVAQYKQTILGPLWFLIQPLLTTIVFTLIFGRFAGLPTDGLPQFLFYMAGNVMWAYFSKILTTTATTFTANAQIFGKVYFPRLAVPVSVSISSLITFAIQFTLFLGFMAYFAAKGAAVAPNMWLLTFPLLIVLMAALGLGFGIVVSSATTKYRDLHHLVSFGTQLLMYGTPIIYPLSTVPEKYRLLVMANPMSAIVETFRYGFLGAGTVSPMHLAYSVLFTVVLVLSGIVVFNRVERTFMDTV